MGSTEEADWIAPVKAYNSSKTKSQQNQQQQTEQQQHEDTEQDSFSDAQESSESTLDPEPDSTLGYDFENQQTRSQLDLMDELQRLGVSKYLDLPQLVVVGEQSVGKSSVLQAVTGIPFTIYEGMCTRFATEILLKRTKPGTSTTIHVCIIPDEDESAERKETLKEWSPLDFDCTASLDNAMMKDIFTQAQNTIFETPTSSPGRRNHALRANADNRLSSSTLQITRSGPKETNFAIVDIPGLVREQSKDRKNEHRTAKNLVEKYLKNTRSIIVVVIDVVDLERHAIFDMLSDLSDKESRVIGVINKCDTKQKQAADWVFDLIRNVDPKSSPQYLKEGWYGLKNRANHELLVSDDERDRLEKEFFEGDEWNSLNEKRLGRGNLKDALIRMQNNHIKRSIPDLLAEIDRELNKCVSRIDQLGEPRNTPVAQFAMINKIATKYSEMARGAVDGHYSRLRGKNMYARKRIRADLETFQFNMQKQGFQEQFRTCDEDADMLEGVAERNWSAKFLDVPTYAWVREAIKEHRGLEDSDEVNPAVKAHLWKQQITSWYQIGGLALESIEKTVKCVNEALFTEACLDRNQRNKLLIWLDDDFRAASDAAKFELERILEDEHSSVMTYNPLRAEKQNELRTRRTVAVKKVIISENYKLAMVRVGYPATEVSGITTDAIINSLLHQDSELGSVLSTHDSIAAYYDIASSRFVDNFALQVVERHLLGPYGPLRIFDSEYVTQRLYGDANIQVLNDLAGEEPEVAKERAALEKKRTSLEEARKRAQGFRML